MPNWTGLVRHPMFPDENLTPFTESANGGAGAQNTVTLAAVPGRRIAISRIVVSATPSAAVQSGEVTITNILKKDGTAGTVRYKITENTTGSPLLVLDFTQPLLAVAENTAVVVDIPAIGSGSTTAIEVTGFLVG